MSMLFRSAGFALAVTASESARPRRGSEVSVSWNTGWNINNNDHLQLLWVMFLIVL